MFTRRQDPYEALFDNGQTGTAPGKVSLTASLPPRPGAGPATMTAESARNPGAPAAAGPSRDDPFWFCQVGRIVDDGSPVGSGQMTKSEFLALLREGVEA